MNNKFLIKNREEMEKSPRWMRETEKMEKARIKEELQRRGLKKTFQTKETMISFIKNKLGWPWTIEWREEQKKILEDIIRMENKEYCVQGIFGGGKTTMMISLIYYICLEDICKAEDILICAFNVCIKKEIAKKINVLGKIEIRTYDSFIYRECKKMGYKKWWELNYEGKRKYIREEYENIEENKEKKYVFIDECQDLDISCYKVLEKKYPNAKFICFGDIFQSIQKEPKESMLWWMLNEKKENRKIYFMECTPRVKESVLMEIKESLKKYYPEFKENISKWKSTSVEKDTAKIRWQAFNNYNTIFKYIKEQVKEKGCEKIMILTFSSAITVRGSLGDIARFRTFLKEENIYCNDNYKEMEEDKIFLSTVNSSKGLERDNVICILTFPLELAFANFSNDLVMNLISVGLTRSKKNIDFFVPVYNDRFSILLYNYPRCPIPKIIKKKESEGRIARPLSDDEIIKENQLEQEHSVTEILRQNIIKYELEEEIMKYSRVIEKREVPNIPINLLEDIYREEDCAFLGILMENLITTLWTNEYPRFELEKYQNHDIFENHINGIQRLEKEYKDFISQSKCIKNIINQYEGCYIYARLLIWTTQKIEIRWKKEQKIKILRAWTILKTKFEEIKPKKTIKTQYNIKMHLVNGIMDAVILPTEENMHIYEIKASRKTDWRREALLQVLMYGLMIGQGSFNCTLINVFSGKIEMLEVNWSRNIIKLREKLINQVMNWNLNCILAKREGEWKENIVFIDIQWKEDKVKEIIYCQFHSKTRAEFHYEEEPTNEMIKEKIKYFEHIYSINEYICFDEKVKEWIKEPRLKIYKTIEKEYRDKTSEMCFKIYDYLQDI